MLRRKDAFGARERVPRSRRLDEDRRVGVGERSNRGRVFGVLLLPKKLWRTGPRASQLNFQVRWGWIFLFSPLYKAKIREEHAYYGFQGPLHLFDQCRLGLFLAHCAKGSSRSNFSWIQLPRWPRWEIASYLYGACSVLPPEFWNTFFGFILYHPIQLSRLLGMSSESSTMLLVACVAGQLAGGFRRSWQFAKRAARGGCGSSMARGPIRDVHSEDFRDWEVGQFADALVLRSLRAVPGVWRLLVWEQADDINSECFSLLGS